MGATFLCRTNPDKDFCNGLVGQAWVIEALAAGSARLGEPSWLEIARDVFRLHPFDEELGLWRVVNTDGSYRGFDVTFNHQLWFAACGSAIPDLDDGVIGGRVLRFLDRAASAHLGRVSRGGRIRHHLAASGWAGRAANVLAALSRPRRSVEARRAAMTKEIGYHAFNLYAFAMLRNSLPAHPLWASGRLARAVAYVHTQEFVGGLDQSEFAYGYNPTGFEVAYALEVLDHHGGSTAERRRWWVDRQLARTFDYEQWSMTLGTNDPPTLAARLYQATRLADVPLSPARAVAE